MQNLKSTKNGVLVVSVSILADIAFLVLMTNKGYWESLGVLLSCIFVIMMLSATFFTFYNVAWYELTVEGITKHAMFYKRTFLWHEIKDLYFVTYRPTKNNTIEGVVITKNAQEERLTYAKANASTRKNISMAISLTSQEMKCPADVSHFDKEQFVRFVESRGIQIKPEV